MAGSNLVKKYLSFFDKIDEIEILVKALRDKDGRIVVISANSIRRNGLRDEAIKRLQEEFPNDDSPMLANVIHRLNI